MGIETSHRRMLDWPTMLVMQRVLMLLLRISITYVQPLGGESYAHAGEDGTREK